MWSTYKLQLLICFFSSITYTLWSWNAELNKSGQMLHVALMCHKTSCMSTKCYYYSYLWENPGHATQLVNLVETKREIFTCVRAQTFSTPGMALFHTCGPRCADRMLQPTRQENTKMQTRKQTDELQGQKADWKTMTAKQEHTWSMVKNDYVSDYHVVSFIYPLISNSSPAVVTSLFLCACECVSESWRWCQKWSVQSLNLETHQVETIRLRLLVCTLLIKSGEQVPLSKWLPNSVQPCSSMERSRLLTFSEYMPMVHA